MNCPEIVKNSCRATISVFTCCTENSPPPGKMCWVDVKFFQLFSRENELPRFHSAWLKAARAYFTFVLYVIILLLYVQSSTMLYQLTSYIRGCYQYKEGGGFQNFPRDWENSEGERRDKCIVLEMWKFTISPNGKEKSLKFWKGEGRVGVLSSPLIGVRVYSKSLPQPSR